MIQDEIEKKATTQDRQPGIEAKMNPEPEFLKATYKPAGKPRRKSCAGNWWRQWYWTSCISSLCIRRCGCCNRLSRRT